MTTATASTRRGSRLEWALGLAAAAAAVAVMCWVGRGMWFRLDVWDFLTGREAGSFASWVLPHAGHLQWLTVGLHRLLYGAVGLDFWPWYYLPHVVGFALLGLLMWRAVLRRGADRGVAFITLLVMLFLGASAFLSSIGFGALVVMALLLVVAQRLDAPAVPVEERALIAAALLLMATSSTLGVAALAAIVVTLALTRGLRRWWWALLPAAAAYGTWYAFIGADARQGRIRWGYLVHVPGDILVLLGNATGRLLGLGSGGLALGAVVAVGLGAGFGWLAWKRRLRRWDLLLLGTLAVYLLMVTLVRGASGTIPLELPRYAYTVITLLVPLVVPHLRFPARLPAGARLAALVLVGGCLVGLNAYHRVADTNALEREVRAGRLAIETVAQLVAAGEPAVDEARLKYDLGIGMGGVLTVADLRAFLADGWAPAPAGGWPGRDEARARLRVLPAPPGQPASAAPPLAVPAGVAGGCLVLPAGGEQRFAVVAAGEFTLRPAGREPPTAVGLAWQDGFGTFTQQLAVSRRAPLRVAAPPVGGAELVVTNLGERRLSVCGVAAGG